MSRLAYRPEIDGLRAIAVIFVVFYHTKLNWIGSHAITGGFIGVDVFFVISGYLITNHILAEISENTFSIWKFYERRIRRILPALFFVMICIMPFAWKLLLPGDLVSFAKSSIATVLFYSNFHFWLETGYFDAPAEVKPLLHTWSLSLEEQFYIFLPLIALFFERIRRQRYFIPALFVVFALSLRRAHFLSATDVAQNFFLLPTRIWELLAGSFLATRPKSKVIDSAKGLVNIFPIIGLCLLFYSCLSFDQNTRHPSLITVIPIIGTCLIIAFGDSNKLILQFLASKPLRWIGLLSYSIYLWHQPIFVFARMVSIDELTRSHYIGLILLTVILAYFSWRLIETPFRSRRTTTTRSVVASISTAALVILVANSLAIYYSGFPARFPATMKNVMEATYTAESLRQDGRVCYSRDPSDACVFDTPSIPNHTKNDWYIIGDSNAGVLMTSLKDRIDLLHDRITLFPVSGCGYLPGLIRALDNPSDTNSCHTVANGAHRILLNQKPGIVVISQLLPMHIDGQIVVDPNTGKISPLKSSHQYYYELGKPNEIDSPERISAVIAQTRHAIEELIEHGHKVILIYPVPEMTFHTTRTLIKAGPRFNIDPEWFYKRLSVPTEFYRARTATSFFTYNSVSDGPNLIRIYPHEFFCDKFIPGRCAPFDMTNVYYFDENHVSKAGAKVVLDKVFHEAHNKWDVNNIAAP